MSTFLVARTTISATVAALISLQGTLNLEAKTALERVALALRFLTGHRDPTTADERGQNAPKTSEVLAVGFDQVKPLKLLRSFHRANNSRLWRNS